MRFGILQGMDTALIVVGLVLAGALLIWVYAHLSDAEEIDEEEEQEVRAQTPEVREREEFNQQEQGAQSNAEDIAFYSPGDSNSE